MLFQMCFARLTLNIVNALFCTVRSYAYVINCNHDIMYVIYSKGLVLYKKYRHKIGTYIHDIVIMTVYCMYGECLVFIKLCNTQHVLVQYIMVMKY